MGKCSGSCPERKLLRFLCAELKSNCHCESTLFKTQVAAAIQLKPVGQVLIEWRASIIKINTLFFTLSKMSTSEKSARKRGRVGLVVRVLAVHQCGWISTLGIICALRLLVLFSVLKGFSPGTLVFRSHQKLTFDLIWFDLMLFSGRIVKRIWSYIHANLRYRKFYINIFVSYSIIFVFCFCRRYLKTACCFNLLTCCFKHLCTGHMTCFKRRSPLLCITWRQWISSHFIRYSYLSFWVAARVSQTHRRVNWARISLQTRWVYSA